MQELLRPPPEALNVHTGGPEACAEGAHPVLVRALTPPPARLGAILAILYSPEGSGLVAPAAPLGTLPVR